ncbi:MAG: SCO family protein [Bacteroidota bacterium]
MSTGSESTEDDLGLTSCMNMQCHFLLLLIGCLPLLLLGQNNQGADLAGRELLISQMDKDGMLDTFDLVKVINGTDKEHRFIDQNGQQIDYRTFQKKVVLLDFWFLRCRPCMMELPGLELLHKKVNSDQFDILTFANDPMSEIEEKLLSKRQFRFRIVPQVFLVSNKGYPLKMLVNRKAEIVDLVNHGNASDRAVQLLLDKYLPMVRNELKRP